MSFLIIAGDFEGKRVALTWNGLLQITHGFTEVARYTVSQIVSVELIEGDKIAAGKGLGFAAAGMLVAGPLGAVVAGGLGSLAGKHVFVIELDDGKKIMTKGYRADYNNFKMVAAKNQLTRVGNGEGSA